MSFEGYPIELPQVSDPESFQLLEPAQHIAYWSAHSRGLADAAKFYTAFTPAERTAFNPSAIGSVMARELIHSHIDHNHTRIALAESAYANQHDPKTGLLNESGLKLAMDRIATPDDYLFVYADGTNVRAVDELLGEKKVNTLFQELADVMTTSMRKDDIIARPYGDTYVALVDVRPKGNKRRRGDVPLAEQATIIRRRVNTNMIEVLERHNDARELGFQLAVGVIRVEAGRSLQEHIDAAKAAMKAQKEEQHATLGEYRPKLAK